MSDEPRKDPPPPSLSPPPPSKPAPIPEVPKGPPGPPPEEAPTVEPLESSLEDESDEPGSIARLNPRLLAGLIDCIVAGALYGLVLTVFPTFRWTAWVETKLAYLVFAAYLAFRDSIPQLNNQSIGKMAMKLKVEKLDGSSISQDWKTGLLRNVLLVVGLGIVEAIVLIARDNGKDRGTRLGDEWAKTRVVVAGERDAQPEGDEAGGDAEPPA